jgi:hypothetical protein
MGPGLPLFPLEMGRAVEVAVEAVRDREREVMSEVVSDL